MITLGSINTQQVGRINTQEEGIIETQRLTCHIIRMNNLEDILSFLHSLQGRIENHCFSEEIKKYLHHYRNLSIHDIQGNKY